MRGTICEPEHDGARPGRAIFQQKNTPDQNVLFMIQMLNMEKLFCRIYGRVQMVMFRDFATRKARKCRVVGYVRNRADGSVEVYGEGAKEDIERWLVYLRRGPVLAHVERIEMQWNMSPPSDMTQRTFDSFEIVF